MSASVRRRCSGFVHRVRDCVSLFLSRTDMCKCVRATCLCVVSLFLSLLRSISVRTQNPACSCVSCYCCVLPSHSRVSFVYRRYDEIHLASRTGPPGILLSLSLSPFFHFSFPFFSLSFPSISFPLLINPPFNRNFPLLVELDNPLSFSLFSPPPSLSHYWHTTNYGGYSS